MLLTQDLLIQFLNHHPGLAFIKDEEGRYLYVNPQFGAFFGVPLAEIIGKTDFDWLPEEIARQFTENDKLVRETGRSLAAVEVVRIDGIDVHSLVNKFPIKTDSGVCLIGGTAIDISDRVLAEHALRESQERLAKALEASGSGTWDWDVARGRIHWDEYKHRIFGVETGRFDGSLASYLSCVHPEDRDRVRKTIDTVLAGQSEFDIEFRIVLRDKSVRHVVERGSVSRDRLGRPTTLRGITTDVTERRRMEEDARLVNLLQQRENFMATLTHDLKNPLLGANRVLELLVAGQVGEMNAEQVSLLKKMQHSNRALLGMIQNLLDVYRLERNALAMMQPDVPVALLVSAYLEDFGNIAADRKIKIVTEMAEPSPLVEGDVNSLRRVVHNLMDNAIKFSPQGSSIHVRVRKDNGQAVLEVEDRGPGISISDQKRLFHRFWQGREGRRFFSSTGLGLYLCREIVEAHHGKISCVSQVGHGSTFIVELPLCRAQPGAAASPN